MSKVGRSRWFANRAAQPGTEADGATLLRRRVLSGKPYHWESLGPTNIGGRSTCLVSPEGYPESVLLGAACGGVWYSDNAGRKWYPYVDDSHTLNIGSFAVDPRDPTILYVGTGEANLTMDSYPGVGVFRCTASGPKWIGRTTDHGLPRRIGAVAVDPHSDVGHVYIGAATSVEGEAGGLYEGLEQSDGSWKWVFHSGYAFGDASRPADPGRPSPPYRCHSIVFHPDEKGVLFASVNMRGWRSGIWRLRDGVWEHLTKGLPPGECFGRTSLAISPLDPKVIWAYAAHRRDSVLGVFFSLDGGDNWSATGESHFTGERSTYYNNCIAIHPGHADWVICGGVDLHRTQDGGVTWEQVTEWDLPVDDPHYSHADHHALAVTKDGWVYDANDGGMGFSEDFGGSWAPRGAGLVTTMFYDLDVAPSNPKIIIGGAQDNGTIVHNAADPKGEFTEALGGDGGWAVIDPDDADHVWGSSQHVDISVSDSSGWSEVSPADLTDEEREKVWMSFLAMDTSPGRASPRPVFLGTTRIWKTRDNGNSWNAVSPVLDGSPVSAIEVADADSSCVYAATEMGGFFRSRDGGNTWSENLAGIDLPYSYITRIESHPKDPEHVLLTVGSTLKDRYAHVFQSLDWGRTWGSADPELKLPPVPHNSLTFETVTPYRVFVATDIGVYCGVKDAEGNYAWDDLIGNLPNVIVTDVVYSAKTRVLTVATYGRGIFRLSLKEAKGKKAARQAAKRKPAARKITRSGLA